MGAKFVPGAQPEGRVVYNFDRFITNEEYYIIMLLCDSTVVTYLAIELYTVCPLSNCMRYTYTHLLCTHYNHDREKDIRNSYCLVKSYLVFGYLSGNSDP